MAELDPATGPANDTEPSVVPPAEPNAAAVALALGRVGKDKTLNAKAAEFLDEQTRFLRLQSEHLHEQRALQVEHLKHQEKHLRLRYFGDRLRIILQLLGVVAGLAVIVFIAALAWNAHDDHGVAIEAFSVPPDLAQRGLTGQVAASQLLDRLAQLQQQTVTSRPASSYANDWGGDIKVEIPETGVSIGELNRYLRQWLGSGTRINGEIVRTPAGITVTARADDAPGRRFEGPEVDIDKLIGQAAEAVYRQTQPYRYAVYLASSGRSAEATAAFARLAVAGLPDERAWAYAGWASTLFQDGRFRESIPAAEAAIRLNPRLAPAYLALNGSLEWVDRPEDHLVWGRRELALLKSGQAVGLPPAEAANRILQRQFVDAIAIGDYRRAAQLGRGLEPMDVEGRAGPGASYVPYDSEIQALASDHDVTGSRAFAALHPQDANPGDPVVLEVQEGALDRWNGLAPNADRLLRDPASLKEPMRFLKGLPVLASVATIYAHAGRFADAEALLQTTPPDCYDCLQAHGLVAALRRDWPAADRWYGEAARRGPSLPFAHTGWGQALLWKGDLDGAIAKLEEAHRRSPHFADPLELWGEALMKKGDYAGAIARFAEADNGAPRWGRNHLRWGEALMLSGRYAEARAQFATANGMDLSTPDRAALDVLLARTASGPLHG
jgi:tetratricopeptide (TPR) repeat protein